jgi:hypothetical protein
MDELYMPPEPILTLPEVPVLPRILERLPEAEAYAVLVLTALLANNRKLDGPSCHHHLDEFLRSGLNTESELLDWTRGRFADRKVGGKAFDKARKQADLRLKEGRWVASWKGAFPPSKGSLRCPRVVFGMGSLDPDQLWAAFFNSRKQKIVSPQAEWLLVLRDLLPVMGTRSLGLASSIGTLTYDLVSAGAEQFGTKLFLLVPMPLEEYSRFIGSPLQEPGSFPRLLLTCQCEAAKCPKPTRMVCRDRLLALLSDLHCILELRHGGNLLQILKKQQKEEPRLQWICGLGGSTVVSDGRHELVQQVFPSAVHVSSKKPAVPAGSDSSSIGLRHSLKVLDAANIRWQDYLYHYTRSCPGPWPNQSYRSYLVSLLKADSLAGHSALETLAQMLSERRILASSKVVRGAQAVISWTSRPPGELSSIRRWNPTLIRWTFEPYGIAVKRRFLKDRGAKPVIYITEARYQKLSPLERFRFQLHEPTRCSWKDEREWRLLGDLNLQDITLEEVFVFIPSSADAQILAEHGGCTFPIVVLGC